MMIEGFGSGFLTKMAFNMEAMPIPPHILPPFKNAKEYVEYILSLHKDPSISNVERNALLSDLESPRMPVNRNAGILPFLTGGLSTAVINAFIRSKNISLPAKLAILAGGYAAGHETGKRIPGWLAPGFRLDSLKGDLSEKF